MCKRRLLLGLLGLIAVATAVGAFLVATERTRTSAWKDAFALRLEALKNRDRPTSYADLNIARHAVSPHQNGAELLARLPAEFDTIATEAPGPYFDPFPDLLSVEGPEPETVTAARTALDDQGARIRGMWEMLDAVTALGTIQGTYKPPSDSGHDLSQGMRCVPPLMMLRAWAHPERQVEFAMQTLTLAHGIEVHGGYYYFRRQELLREGLRLLRIALERGRRPSVKERASLLNLLTGFQGRALSDLRDVTDFYRVYWAHYADPSLERWSWISDYDHFGEGWTLYRDMIRAFDRMDDVDAELQSEAGARAIGARDEEVADWNSQLPGIGYVAGKALEVLSLVRLATLAVRATESLNPEHPSRPAGPALAQELIATAKPDAMTGESFVVQDEGSSLFIYVPWREIEFPLRPVFARGPWHPDYNPDVDEPPPTLEGDSLREGGWIWMIPRR